MNTWKKQNTPFQDVSSPAAENKAPEPEVLERPLRRRFSAAYKLQILSEVDAAVEAGEVGAILRREGLYYSNIYKWRQQLKRSETEHLAPKKRGRKPKKADFNGKRLKDLERENRRLQKRLDRAHLLLEIQKKISEIAGIPLKQVNLDDYDL
jgi:transposase-like protein